MFRPPKPVAWDPLRNLQCDKTILLHIILEQIKKGLGLCDLECKLLAYPMTHARACAACLQRGPVLESKISSVFWSREGALASGDLGAEEGVWSCQEIFHVSVCTSASRAN